MLAMASAPLREVYRRVKGPLWGSDNMIFQRDPTQLDITKIWCKGYGDSCHIAPQPPTHPLGLPFRTGA